MTTVVIKKNSQGQYLEFICMGHAGYGRRGKDIVCASVSALVINTVNCLETLAGESFQLTENEADGFLRCVFPHPLGEKGVLLMDSLVLGLKSIENEAGRKYLQLRLEEV